MSGRHCGVHVRHQVLQDTTPAFLITFETVCHARPIDSGRKDPRAQGYLNGLLRASIRPTTKILISRKHAEGG